MTADVPPERPDTSVEVALDPAPETPARDPVYVDVVAKDADRRPIVAAARRGRANLRATAGHTGGRWAHATGYQSVRAPRYLALGAFWAVVGVVRAGRQLGWCWLAEQRQLRHNAVGAGDPLSWLKLHQGPGPPAAGAAWCCSPSSSPGPSPPACWGPGRRAGCPPWR